MAFSNSAVINYPVEKVFNVFIRSAKHDFPKFDENNPIGCKVVKEVGSYSNKSGKLEVEIIGYKKNELYEIRSTSAKREYVSKYTFDKVSEDSTRITLAEEDRSSGFVVGVNAKLQSFLFKKRVKKRFEFFIEGLEHTIKSFDEKIAKNSKPKCDEDNKTI